VRYPTNLSTTMIVFDLKCDAQHSFEGWFKDSADFETQLTQGLLTCPTCGSATVVKVPSASRVHVASTGERRLQELQSQSEQLLRKLHEHIDRHYDNVGTEFAEEARKMHYGERDPRNIRGQATTQEVNALHEEGIDVLPIPPDPRAGEKLN